MQTAQVHISRPNNGYAQYHAHVYIGLGTPLNLEMFRHG